MVKSRYYNSGGDTVDKKQLNDQVEKMRKDGMKGNFGTMRPKSDKRKEGIK